MVVFDASVLIDLFHPRTPPERKAKLEHLIADLQRKKVKIVIPTPALSEFLARAGKARDTYHARLSTSATFRITPFDSRAALECALLLDAALTGGDKRAQAKTWAKPNLTGKSFPSPKLPTHGPYIRRTAISPASDNSRA